MAIQQVDLVGNSGRPLVTPQAVEQLSDAFRRGFVSADDIMERVSERTRAKQEFELVTANQGIAEATDPALIEAKKNQQLLAGEQAKQQRDLLPLARRATEEKLNADIRSGQIARYGLKEKLEALNNVGFAPAPDPDKGITPEFALEVNKKFGTMLRWQKKKADAIFNSALFDAGEIVTDAGTFSGPMDKVTGAPADPKQISKWRKDAAETFPEFLLAEPGEVVAPIAQAASLIQPRAATSVAGPVIQPSGVPPGFVQVKPSTTIVRPTEGQQRALLAVPRFKEANAALQNLQAKGYDATSWGSWVDSYMPQIVKSGNRKELETAMSAWTQGLLRLESGAAITPKEEGWYVNTFFPVVKDPPSVVAQKAALRASVEEMVKEVGIAGEIPEDIKLNVRALRNSLPGGAVTSDAPLPASSAAPSTAPVFTLTEASKQPSGTVFKDANGNWRRKL